MSATATMRTARHRLLGGLDLALAVLLLGTTSLTAIQNSSRPPTSLRNG